MTEAERLVDKLNQAVHAQMESTGIRTSPFIYQSDGTEWTIMFLEYIVACSDEDAILTYEELKQKVLEESEEYNSALRTINLEQLGGA